MVVVGSALVDVTPSTRGLLATVASVAVIAGLYAAPSGPAARLLALPVPRFLGQISYGTYLWHWPVILVVGQLFDVGALVLVALAAPVATGLAALSYEIFERPIRKAPALDRFRWPVVGAGLGVSLIAAVFVIPPLLQSTVRPVVGNPEPADLSALAEQAAWLEEPVPPGLDLVAALDDVPEAGEPCTTDDLEVCVRVDRQRRPGPARRRQPVGHVRDGVRVARPGARPHAPDQHRPRLRLAGGPGAAMRRRSCTTFYPTCCRCSTSTSWWPSASPEVSPSGRRGSPTPAAPPARRWPQLHVRTAQETADLVHEAGARLVIVKALLGTNGYRRNGPDPLDCLARADRLGDCAVVTPLEKPFTDGILDALAASSPDDTAAVDLNPVLCPDAPICRPVIGTTVVWKDPDHVTGTFLDEQREALWAKLTETGFW